MKDSASSEGQAPGETMSLSPKIAEPNGIFDSMSEKKTTIDISAALPERVSQEETAARNFELWPVNDRATGARDSEAQDMDRPSENKRMFPAYTTAQLEASIAKGVTPYNNAETVAKMKSEVEARKSGASVHRPTPQVPWK